MRSLNKEYVRLLREILSEPEIKDRINWADYMVHKQNRFSYQGMLKKLEKLRGKIDREKIFKGVFESMAGVFARIDKGITKDIKKIFKSSNQPIPEVVLSAPSQVLEDVIKLNVELIKAIELQQVENLENVIKNAVQNGNNIDAIMKEVQKQSDRGLNYAQFVAEDQVAKAHAGINEERQKAVGFDEYEWVATNAPVGFELGNVRPTHAALDGTIQRWDQPPLVGDRNLHPGEDYRCRCIAVPVF